MITSEGHMPGYEFQESDWRLFRQRLPLWQERYMSHLLNDYSELIGGEGTPSERFLELAERIDSDRKLCAVSADMRRSMMVPNLYSLIEEKAIGFVDLDGFSEGLVECLRHLAEQ